MYCSIAQMWNPWMMGWGIWFWVLIIAGFGYLMWSSYRLRTNVRMSIEDPIGYARRRLASGEITVEEFEGIKKAIEESR